MKNENKYKELYAMGILTILTLILMPAVIWWWNFTLTAPFEAVNNEVKTETVQENKKEMDQNDIYEMNKKTFLTPVKSLELVHENEKYYLLRNNEGYMYISDDENLRHDTDYVLEIDEDTDEIVSIKFDMRFEFDEIENELFDEWYHSDIEDGRIMLNEYLGIVDYTASEISI